MRVHSTTATRFFIHVSTKAIVEDCGSVSFGPYDLSYPGMELSISQAESLLCPFYKVCECR